MTWHTKAACRGLTAWFFDDRHATEARLVCHRCPVRVECRAETWATQERHGVRAGMTPAERADWFDPDGLTPDPRLPAGLEHGRNLYRSKHKCRCAECVADYRAYDREIKANAKERATA